MYSGVLCYSIYLAPHWPAWKTSQSRPCLALAANEALGCSSTLVLYLLIGRVTDTLSVATTADAGQRLMNPIFADFRTRLDSAVGFRSGVSGLEHRRWARQGHQCHLNSWINIQFARRSSPEPCTEES
ncbi:uncharacterized protein BDW70DRAFT_8794 [Aspergillus foveolatus]|uniref:uncharacterized protein n=1 Tax=Aspergillus foveolatus TaxID=210207 RepID=UPI003CCD5009